MNHRPPQPPRGGRPLSDRPAGGRPARDRPGRDRPPRRRPDDSVTLPPPPVGRAAFSTLGGPIMTLGEMRSAKILARAFAVDPERTRTLTHGFHPYAARLHPSIAATVIEQFSRVQDCVLDPFCGSGTVVVEAMVAGRRALGSDASPLAVELTAVKVTPLHSGSRGRLCALAREISEESARRAKQRVRLAELPAWGKIHRTGYAPHVFLELLGLRELVLAAATAIGDADLARVLRLCLSSMLAKFAEKSLDPAGGDAPGRVGPTTEQDDAPARRIGRGIPSYFFAARVEEFTRALQDLERAGGRAPRPAVVRADARRLASVSDNSVDLIVTSPPYAGVYDYASQHAIRYAFLNLPADEFVREQVGTPERGFGTPADPWRVSRHAWCREMARVLRPGGRAVLAVGDGVISHRPEDSLAETREAGHAAGLETIAAASEPRSPLDRRLRAIFGEQPRREHLILFEKNARRS